jgi:hypothetical protein
VHSHSRHSNAFVDSQALRVDNNISMDICQDFSCTLTSLRG